MTKPYAYRVISDGSHELALTIINDGKGYAQRTAFGRRAYEGKLSDFGVQNLAHRWLQIATAGARAYERQFGSPGASCFTAADILGAAIEVADYYEQHARETATV